MRPHPKGTATRDHRQISFDEYRRRVGQMFYPLQARAPKDCRLSISDFASRRAGEFRFTKSAIEHDGPIGGVRLWEHIAGDTPDEFVLIVADTAALRYTQFRRQVELPVDSMMLLDARNPYEYERCFSGRVTCYHLPGRVLRDVLPFPEDLCAIRIDSAGGIGGALRSFVGLAWNQSVIDEDVRERLFHDIATLIPVAAGTAAARPIGKARPDAMERAQAFVDANLSNPRLSVADVARAVGISTGRLHALARVHGEGIGRMMLARRLDACAAALDSGRSERRLIDIAMDYGFVSPSHFSRAFRERFGCTPSAYARQRPGVRAMPSGRG
jgi:AraC-like DNA-binding protein